MPATSRPSVIAGSTAVFEDVDDVAVVAVEDGVDQVDVRLRRDVLDGQLDVGARPPGRRQPAELDREQQLEQQAQEEDRHGVGEDREQPQADVGKPVAVARRDPAQRDSDGQGEQGRPERELERGRALDDDHVADLLVVRDRRAEVEVRDALQVIPVLRKDRAVEPGVVLADRDLIGWQPPAERRRDRITDHPHHEEDHGDQHPHHGDNEQQPRHQIGAQRPR